MKLAVLARQDESFSLKIYRENVANGLIELGCKIMEFSKQEKIPEDCDMVWDPGIAGSEPPHKGFKSSSKPLVATVHGAAPFVMPWKAIASNIGGGLRIKLQNYLTLRRWQWFRKKVKAIIAVSRFGLKEISQVYHLPEESIFVIYHGVNHNIFKPEGERNRDGYFLVVGANRPIKNADRIFMAYQKIPENNRPGMTAVLPGYKRELNIKGLQIIRTGFDSKGLARFYRGAAALVFPSLRESFGMPIIEAMACGCPVITSNSTACAEIAGDAALLVNPRSVDEIASAMSQLIEDESLRQSLRQKGLARASQFTWRKSAEEHLRVFEEALSGRYGS